MGTLNLLSYEARVDQLRLVVEGSGGGELGFKGGGRGGGVVWMGGGGCGCAAAAEKFSSNGVGGDGGGRGRATVQMPRLLEFYYKVGGGGVRATVEYRGN